MQACFLVVSFRIVGAFEEIVYGDIEIVGEFYERLVVGFTRTGLVHEKCCIGRSGGRISAQPKK